METEPILILTVGYGGRKLEDLIALLKQYEVTHVVDVRSAPHSKFAPEFNRDALENSLRKYRIGYLYLGKELGGRPDCPDCYDSDGVVLYEQVRKQEFFHRGIQQLLQCASVPGRKLCLLCSERKPEECHRSKLIGDALSQISDPKPLQILHISEDGQLIEQSEVMKRVDNGQLNLFVESHQVSRKSYPMRPKANSAEAPRSIREQRRYYNDTNRDSE